MRINISLKSEVVKKADKLAKSYGLSRSSLISYLITKNKNLIDDDKKIKIQK